MERREFLKTSLSAGILFAIPLLNSSCEKEDNKTNSGLPPGGTLTIDLDSSQYVSLKSAGNFTVVSSNNIIIANTGDEFVALSSVCTHQGCTISYSGAANNFPCACHGSVFSTAGSVLAGPAPTPVKKFNVSRTGNILTITG